MQKHKYSYVALVVLIVFSSWLINQTKDIKKAEWLIGTWENKTSKGIVYETWSKTNENEFSGKSYILKLNDTIVLETIRLVMEQGQLFYIPTVTNQNKGLPVRFAGKTISESKLVFENLQHDFPQIISYTKLGSDSLMAEIFGTKNGQERKQAFGMKRVINQVRDN